MNNVVEQLLHSVFLRFLPELKAWPNVSIVKTAKYFPSDCFWYCETARKRLKLFKDLFT